MQTTELARECRAELERRLAVCEAAQAMRAMNPVLKSIATALGILEVTE